jgi:hypothetical protein
MCPIPGDVYEKYVKPGSSNCAVRNLHGVRILSEERSYKDVRLVQEKSNKNASVDVLKIECERAYNEWQCMIQFNAGEMAITALEKRYNDKKKVLDLMMPSLPVLFAKEIVVREGSYDICPSPVNVSVEGVTVDLAHEDMSSDDINSFLTFFEAEFASSTVSEFIDQDFVNSFFDDVDISPRSHLSVASYIFEEPEDVQTPQCLSVCVETKSGENSSNNYQVERKIDGLIPLFLSEKINFPLLLDLPIYSVSLESCKVDSLLTGICESVNNDFMIEKDKILKRRSDDEEVFGYECYKTHKELGEIFGFADVGELCLVGGVRTKRKNRREEKIPVFNSAPSYYVSSLDYIDHSPYRKSDNGAVGWSYSNDLFSYFPFRNKGCFGRDFRHLSSLYECWVVKQIKVFCDYNSGMRPSVYALIGNSNGNPQFTDTTYDGLKNFVFDSGEPDRFVAPYGCNRSSYDLNIRYFASRTRYKDIIGTIDSSPVKKYSVSVVAFDPQGPDLFEAYPLIRVKFIVEWSVLRGRPLDMSWYDET